MEKGLQRSLGKGQGHLNALNEKVRQHAICFLRSLRCTCFRLSSLCPEKGLQRSLEKGQGHFKCIKSKGQTTSNMFFEVTKVHMFPFVLTVSLNMTEAYFPLF